MAILRYRILPKQTNKQTKQNKTSQHIPPPVARLPPAATVLDVNVDSVTETWALFPGPVLTNTAPPNPKKKKKSHKVNNVVR